MADIVHFNYSGGNWAETLGLQNLDTLSQKSEAVFAEVAPNVHMSISLYISFSSGHTLVDIVFLYVCGLMTDWHMRLIFVLFFLYWYQPVALAERVIFFWFHDLLTGERKKRKTTGERGGVKKGQKNKGKHEKEEEKLKKKTKEGENKK